MQHDNKVLISAILILGVGLAPYNLFGISGNIGAENVGCESISVSAPSSVSLGKPVPITIKSPPQAQFTNYNGVKEKDPYIYMYREGTERIDRQPINRATLKTLSEDGVITVNFPSIGSIGGYYTFGVGDKCTGDTIHTGEVYLS